MASTPTSYGSPAIVTALPGLNTATLFSAAFFSATLLTDLAYWSSAQLMWQNFSAWLLMAGLVSGGIAAILWLISLATDRIHAVWGSVLLQAAILIIAFLNSLVHAGDGWTGVVPWGIGLSAVMMVLMIANAWITRATLTARHAPRY